MPARSTVEAAIETINGVMKITRREMLEQGIYLSDTVENEKLAAQGAICGGHKACLFGSVFLASGQPIRSSRTGMTYLEGVDSLEREKFIARRPALKLACGTLNRLAEKRLDKEGWDGAGGFTDYRKHGQAAEEFFENFLMDADPALVRAEVLALCNAAKRDLRKLLHSANNRRKEQNANIHSQPRSRRLQDNEPPG